MRARASPCSPIVAEPPRRGSARRSTTSRWASRASAVRREANKVTRRPASPSGRRVARMTAHGPSPGPRSCRVGNTLRAARPTGRPRPASGPAHAPVGAQGRRGSRQHECVQAANRSRRAPFFSRRRHPWGAPPRRPARAGPRGRATTRPSTTTRPRAGLRNLRPCTAAAARPRRPPPTAARVAGCPGRSRRAFPRRPRSCATDRRRR